MTRTIGRTEARFRSLVHNAADGIVVVTGPGTVSYASPSARRLFEVAESGPACFGFDVLAARLHPQDAPVVLAAIDRLSHGPAGATCVVAARVRDRAGHWRQIEAAATNRLDDPSVRGLVLNLRDVTERCALEAALRRQATHDPLTELANRTLFLDRTAHAIAGQRRSGDLVAVLFIDVDDFKGVNDGLGHAAGDELLRAVAERLRAQVRAEDTVARLGGDEFAVLLTNVDDHDYVTGLAQRLVESIVRPLVAGGRELTVTGSIGIAFGEAGESAEVLLRNADLAMYSAKRSGKGRYAAYTPDLYAVATAELELRAGLPTRS